MARSFKWGALVCFIQIQLPRTVEGRSQSNLIAAANRKEVSGWAGNGGEPHGRHSADAVSSMRLATTASVQPPSRHAMSSPLIVQLPEEAPSSPKPHRHVADADAIPKSRGGEQPEPAVKLLEQDSGDAILLDSNPTVVREVQERKRGCGGRDEESTTTTSTTADPSTTTIHPSTGSTDASDDDSDADRKHPPDHSSGKHHQPNSDSKTSPPSATTPSENPKPNDPSAGDEKPSPSPGNNPPEHDDSAHDDSEPEYMLHTTEDNRPGPAPGPSEGSGLSTCCWAVIIAGSVLAVCGVLAVLLVLATDRDGDEDRDEDDAQEKKTPKKSFKTRMTGTFRDVDGGPGSAPTTEDRTDSGEASGINSLQ